MDLSRFKKVIAGASAAAITLTQVGTVLAAYSDVPAGVWYEDAVMRFIDAGYLDETQARFRGGDFANRAEFVKLIVELNGGILSTPPAVPSFTDVAPSAWYYGYFEEAGKEAWVKGDNNCYGNSPCYARPGANIVRAEAAALIVRAFGLDAGGLAPIFVDNPSGQWYTDVIQTAADHCVLQGDDGTGRVRPGDTMNRAEMVVMLDRVDQGLTYGVDCAAGGIAEPLITDVVGTSSTTIEVEFNVALDADTAEDAANFSVTCDGQDIPVTGAVLVDTDVVELTLGQAVSPNADCSVAVDGLMTEDGEEFSDALDFGGYSPIARGEGILEASLSASNPVADTVPRGANGVVMLSTDLTASCDDSVIIEDLTILHEGFGAETDISGVYAAIDGARVSRKRTIDSEDQTAQLRLSSPLVIDACETVTVDIVTDFNSTATVSGEHNLVLELASDIVSNALDVTGTFPLRGNTFRVAAVTSGTITSTYRSVTPSEVEVGDVGVVIGKFEISANSVEDQTLYSMTIENNGTASDGDFVNIAIRRTDGTVLTNTVASTVGDFVTLVFDPPFTVLEGDKITLEVIADIVGGAADTIQLTFEETSDIFAVGSLYGYGVNGQLYGSQVTITATPTASVITIDAGQFTIGIDGPVSTDYTRDDNDAVLANVEMTSGGEAVDVRELYVAIQARSSTGAALGPIATAGTNSRGTDSDHISEILEDVELRNTVTGRTIDGVRLTTTDGTDFDNGATSTWQIYRFDDFTVEGATTWELRVDFIDNGAGEHPLAGDQFRAIICTETSTTATCTFGGLITADADYNVEAEGISTGDAITDIRPGTDVAGQFHDISNATLTVGVKALNATDTTVVGADDIRLLRFEARAGEAEDVLVTSFVFRPATGDGEDMSSYALWVDSDGDGVVDTKLEDNVSSEGALDDITFNNLTGGGFVIPADEVVVFEVRGNVSTSAAGTFRLAFSASAAAGSEAYIEAEELDDGSALSGINTDGAGCATTVCDIIVTQTESGIGGTLFTIASQGDLFVKRNQVLKNHQLLGGTVADSVLELAFKAENEDIRIEDLVITGSGRNATSVASMQLFLGNSTTPFATASSPCVGGTGSTLLPTSTASTIVNFCAHMGGDQLIIPGDGGDVIVTARPVIKSNFVGGSGSDVLVSFVLASNDTPTMDVAQTGSVIVARGLESSGTLDMNDGDATAEGEIFIHPTAPAISTQNAIIEGAFNHIVMTKLTSVTNDGPETGQLAAGLREIGRFRLQSAAHNNDGNDFTLSGIILNVNATNVAVTPTGITLANANSPDTTRTCTAYTTAGVLISAAGTNSGSFLVYCSAINSSIDAELSSGEANTFLLKATISNAQISSTTTSSLQVAFQDFSNIAQAFGVSTTGNHIQWVDTGGPETRDVKFNWLDLSVTQVFSTLFRS